MKKILVIEDERSVREVVGEILHYEGYSVILAENGRIGMDKALEFLPDLILCDIMMPEMDGISVLNELRSTPSTTLTPFVYMSALGERENIRLGMGLGADDYLIKPFTRLELIDAVKTRLKKQESIEEKTEQALETLRSNIINRLPHELRTPLTSIIGFGTLLKVNAKALSYEEIEEVGGEILQSGNQLMHLVENYLIYSQLQLRNISDNGDISIIEIKNLLSLVNISLEEKYNEKKSVIIDLQEIEERLDISETYFQKIIYELIDNALKFSYTTKNVTVNGKSQKNYYVFEVSDYGVGMSPEQIKQVGAYMQFNREKQEQQGMGLGLAIAKRMVEISGGEFEIESTKNEGTTVRLKIKKITS